MTDPQTAAEFERVCWGDPNPCVLATPAGVVAARNPAADAALALKPGDDAILGLGAEFGVFLRRCAVSRDGFATRVFAPVPEGQKREMGCFGAAYRTANGAAFVILRFRAWRPDVSNFTLLTRQLDDLRAEVARRRDSEQRLRTLIETTADGVILLDEGGVVRLANAASGAMLGSSADTLVGRGVSDLLPDAANSVGFLTSLSGEGLRETKLLRADGTFAPVEISVGAAADRGRRQYVVTLRDLAERRRLEERLHHAQRLESVGRLAGGVAHDFNNLLTVIMGEGELLAEALPKESETARMAAAIVEAAERGAALTRGLLAFGRRAHLEPKSTDCAQRVAALGAMLLRTLGEDVELVLDCAPETPCAHVDGGQLDAAIMNLAVNARDAMPDGGALTIAVGTAMLDGAAARSKPDLALGEYVMISVTDTGCGMSPDTRARAFEPFFTTKEVGKGSGLGLSQVFGFAAQSGGAASLYSEPGLGTTVRIYLPVDPSTARPAPGVSQDAPRAARAARVLVVEDDEFVRGFAVRCLTALGYAPTPASTGVEALELLSAEPRFDVLFTDIVMPGGMDGWTLVDKARALRPDIRVLLTSGYAVETLARAGRLEGAPALLDKPYRAETLARRLMELMTAPP